MDNRPAYERSYEPFEDVELGELLARLDDDCGATKMLGCALLAVAVAAGFVAYLVFFEDKWWSGT